MREHEAGRLRLPWRWNFWYKRISQAATHVSMLSLLGRAAERSLAAPKNKSRDDRSDGDQSDKDRHRGGDRDQDGKAENDRKGDGRSDRDQNESSDRDGDGRNGGRERRQERQEDDSGDDSAVVARKQKANQNRDRDNESGDRDGGNDTDNPDDGDDTDNPDETGGGRGGRGDGGGNDAGNAGSGLFDNPLATKARRRADDFENADGADEDEGRIIVDVDPEGESVFETDSIFFASGPDGVEIETGNITFFAEPPPPPEPLPRLELPVREPGFPFGEDFPFGNATVTVSPTEPEPPDPGDTAAPPARRAEPIPAADEPEPADTNGGDNTMDFSS